MEVPSPVEGKGTSMKRVQPVTRSLWGLARSKLLDASPVARERLSKIALIERCCAQRLPVRVACHLVGVSKSTYYRWCARLRQGGVVALGDGRAGRRRRRAAPAKAALRVAVEALRRQRAWGKEKLAHTLRVAGYAASSSTVGRVLRDLLERGVVRPVGYARRKHGAQRRAAVRTHAQRKQRGMQPSEHGELVQLDTLREYSLGRVRCQFTAVDPISRRLHAQLYARMRSTEAMGFLEELLSAWPFPIKSIQVDNGSEFKGEFERACAERGIGLFTIPPATPKANGMVERAHRSMRDEHYAFEPVSLSLEEQRQHLKAYVQVYNHERPHQALAYKTPARYAEDRNLQSQQT